MDTNLSPNTAVRAAYIALFAAQNVGVPVWAKKVPLNVKPIPSTYIILSSQTKTRTEVSKDCWNWLISTTIDITFSGPKGFSNTDVVDEIEAKVVTAIENYLVIPGFDVKDISLIDSTDLDTETPTQSVERRILIYQHWLWQE